MRTHRCQPPVAGSTTIIVGPRGITDTKPDPRVLRYFCACCEEPAKVLLNIDGYRALCGPCGSLYRPGVVHCVGGNLGPALAALIAEAPTLDMPRRRRGGHHG